MKQDGGQGLILPHLDTRTPRSHTGAKYRGPLALSLVALNSKGRAQVAVALRAVAQMAMCLEKAPQAAIMTCEPYLCVCVCACVCVPPT